MSVNGACFSSNACWDRLQLPATMRRISVDNGRMDISLSLKCYKSRMMSVWKIFDFEANRGKI